MIPNDARTTPLADRPFWILCALLAIHFLWLSRQLLYPDLVLNYPFIGGDSHDWIANGMFFAGYDVRYSARPPLLPLAVAVLERLGMLDWLPILLQLLVHASTLALYRLLRRDYAAAVAFPLALAWHFNFTWSMLSLEVMADVSGACFLGLSMLFFRRALEPSGGKTAAWVGAGLFAGLGGLLQPVVLLVVPTLVAVVFARRRSELRSRRLWLAVALAVAPTLIWSLVKVSLAGTAGDVLNRHWDLLKLHLDGLSFYFWAFPSFLGLPAAVLTAAGAWLLVRRRGGELWVVFLVGLLVVLLGFFTFIYDYESKRFLTFAFWLSAVPVAEALSRLPRRAFAPIMALAVAGSVLPIQGRGHDPSYATLWPLPPVALVAPTTPNGRGSLVVDLSEIHLTRRPLAEPWSLSVQHEVLAARPKRLEKRKLGPKDFRQDQAALYLFDDPAENGRRYDTVAHLGNLLGKKVFFLPFSEVSELVEHMALVRVGRIDDQRIYRAQLRGLEGTWLVVAPTRGGADRAIYQQLQANRTAEAPPPYGIEQARRVARRLENDFPVVLSNPQVAKSWQVYLPFVIDTTELYVVEPARERGSRRLLESGKVLGRETREGVTITRYELFGQTWALIEEEGI